VGSDGSVSGNRAAANAESVLLFWSAGQASLGHLSRKNVQHGDVEKQFDRERKWLMDQPRFKALDIRGNVILRKARTIAALFSRKQIKQIAQRIKSHRSAFSFSHLLRLSALADSGQRMHLAETAIRSGLSARQIVWAVQAIKQQRRSHVGRKPRIPDHPGQLLAALDANCCKWLRWLGQANGLLPKKLRDRVPAVIDSVRSLQVVAMDSLKEFTQRQARRRTRHQ
jgi:hypothetical protein